MNQKKRTTQTTVLIAMISIVVLLGAVRVGYLLGAQPSEPDTPPSPGLESPPAPTSVSPPPAAPQSKGLSPSELAEAKNVPAQLIDPSGNYQLVAVIEGEEQNLALTSSLQVVGAQRQRLLSLSAQYDRLPASSLQERELVAGEILKARQTLATNLRFMAANYGYSLQHNYRLVPHSASLLLLTSDADGRTTAQLVHKFEDASSYERFQKMRDDYLLLSVKRPQADSPDSLASPASTTQPGAEPAPAEPSQEKPSVAIPSPELEAMQAKLISEFQYDPAKNHQVKLGKTALYGR